MNDKVIKPITGITSYTGKVKITLNRCGVDYKTITTHNAGTSEFFRYILECVSGKGDSSVRPGYLYLYSDSSSTEPIISFGILYDGTTDVQDGSQDGAAYASIKYHFLIPDTLIGGKTIKSLSIKSMHSDETKRVVYATIELDGPLTVASDANVDIEWILLLENM